MTRGKLTVVVGGQYGSEGKGAIVAKIADRYGVHVRVGSPNAGHTIWWRGEKHVMQSVPCGWINPTAFIVIGRGALINMRQLVKEIMHIQQYYPNFLDRLFIDENAGVLDERFHQEEGGVNGEMHARIGSTGEGVGPARIARLKRDPKEFRLFYQVAEEWGLEKCVVHNTPELIADWQDRGISILVEGTQGSALSLLHSYWPYCTSIDTNAAGIISEVGIAPSRVTDVLMVCRTFPIRVHGNSGPMQNEITWDELNDHIAACGGVSIDPERTTVTKKIRRIAEWDDELFKQSCILNAPTEIALTFCDYIDPKLYAVDNVNDVMTSERLQEFIGLHLLDPYDVRVRYYGTGPKTVVEVGDDD